METIKSAIMNNSKGDYFVSVDLKDAYFLYQIGSIFDLLVMENITNLK